MSQLTIEIPTTSAGKRLDKALAELIPDYSRAQIQHWIKAGRVRHNGQVVRGRDRVMGGETVLIELVQEPHDDTQAEDIPLDVVYEDDSLIVINKPVGLVVHPGAGNRQGTLLNALLHHDPQLQTLARGGIIHRLDKDTSGLLVVARTESARLNLIGQLQARSLRRHYDALVNGVLVAGGKVDAPIGRHRVARTRMAVHGRGKEAVTHYRIKQKYRAHTLLDVSLESGRTHQIRVHMAHIKHPIVGDPTYGGRPRLPKGSSDELIQSLRAFKHQALHARALGLKHPDTGEAMAWEVEMPQDMQDLLQALESDSKKG